MRIAVPVLVLLFAAGPMTQALGASSPLGTGDEALDQAPYSQVPGLDPEPPAPSRTSPAGEAAGRGATTDAQAIEDLTGFDLRPRPHVDAPYDAEHHHASGLQVERAPGPTYGPGGTRDMEFICPSGPEVAGIPLPASGGGDDPVVMGCPLRVYDTGWSFGNPDLVVHPEDHRQAAFFALHGSAARDGPSERSRGGLAHTTFTTDQQGIDWQDQPLDFPDGNGFGEYASGAMDSAGNVYAGFLWNLPSGVEDWEPVIGLYKGPTVHERGGMSDAYDYGRYILARDAMNTIREAHVIQLPSYAPLKDINATANETAPPAGEDGVGEAAYDMENATEERIVAVWHESAYDWSNSTTGLSGWIDAAWTHTGSKNEWTRLNRTEVIGPCSHGSDPAYFEDKVYVACTVDRGYADRGRARVGDVDLWSIDVFTGETELVDFTGIRGGGEPLLAINEEGYMTLIVQRDHVAEDGTYLNLEAEAAFSWYGRNWQALGDLGRGLRQMGGAENIPLLDADITALTLTTDDQTAMLVYKEWHDDPQEPQIDENDPDPRAFIGNHLTDYNKYVVSYNACDFPIAAAHMELGTGVDQNNAQSYQEEPGMFNDVQDGLFTVREPGNDMELTYFAINDYGAVQFGAIQVFSASGICFNPPPLLTTPPVPVPQALTLTSPFTAAAGAALAAPAAAMVIYLLTVKKRVAAFATAEDE